MIKIPGKIPVFISPFFWALAFLIGALNAPNFIGILTWVAIILVSVLVHEYGHALTAVAFGQTAQIELVAFGGVTQRKGGGKLKPWQEFIVVLNGPLAGFCLCGVAWVAFRMLSVTNPASILTHAAQIAVFVNLIWTILNLIPVQPLDGGKLLSIILEGIFGLRGTKIALFISLLLGAGLGILFFVQRQYFIGAMFMLFTFESYKAWKESLSVTEEDQNFILQHMLKEAERDMRSGSKDEALSIFQRIREMAKAGVIYETATESAAYLLAEKGDQKQAYELLSSLGKRISPQGIILLHQLAYNLKKWEVAASLGDRAYRSNPSYQTAFINAASHASLGDVKPAIGWLQSAIHDGLPHVKHVLADHEFDGIRNDPLFRNFLETVV